MLDIFRRKSENPATVARKLEERKQDLAVRIAEIKAHIESGNHTPEDARKLAELEAEQNDIR